MAGRPPGPNLARGAWRERETRPDLPALRAHDREAVVAAGDLRRTRWGCGVLFRPQQEADIPGDHEDHAEGLRALTEERDAGVRARSISDQFPRPVGLERFHHGAGGSHGV